MFISAILLPHDYTSLEGTKFVFAEYQQFEGRPIALNFNRNRQIGVIRSVWIDGNGDIRVVGRLDKKWDMSCYSIGMSYGINMDNGRELGICDTGCSLIPIRDALFDSRVEDVTKRFKFPLNFFI